MRKSRVMLTGGGGMVGRNIIEHPKSSNYELFTPTSSELDLTDRWATQIFFNEVKPDIVIHAAGRVGGIQANIANPIDFLVTNTDIGRNVILAAYEAGVPKLVNLASSCIYPRGAANPLNEDSILHGELEPTNEGYALAKIFALRLCQYVNRESRAKAQGATFYKTIIPCNLYGRYDKFDPRHSHLIPAIIHKIHEAKVQSLETVEIWGNGLARREFMYAGDLADAILQGIQDFDQLPELINIGLGEDYTIDEYYIAAAQVIGWQGKFVHNEAKPVGMQRKLVDISQQRRWGWRSPTTLRAGIEASYKYFLEDGSHDI